MPAPSCPAGIPRRDNRRVNPNVVGRIAQLESQLNAMRLQLRGSPGVSTAGGGSLSIRTLQLGFAAELTSCYGRLPPDVTTTTSTTTTSTTTAPPVGTTTTTTTLPPPLEGYCWKRLKLEDAEFVDPTVQLTGCQAYALDGNQALGPGVVVWLEPSPDAVGYIITDYYGVAGPCPTTTTSTSTTPPPCPGGCTWTYSAVTKIWTLISDTCGTTAGCGCYYPDFCPSCSGVQTTTTACIRGATSYGNQPQCNTTTTTLPPTGCTGTCTFKSYPTIGWVKTFNPCLPSCPCPTPTGPGPGDCGSSPVTTNCVSPPPPPPCGGSCGWIWGEDPVGWIQTSNTCAGGYYCACSPPAYDGGVCNELATTPCMGDPTPTTPPPGVCSGRCYWCWSGSAWTFDRTECVGCVCPLPGYDGTVIGEVGVTYCFLPTTTTTTTTTTSTTTSTTTLPPSYCCLYFTGTGTGGTCSTGTFCTPTAGYPLGGSCSGSGSISMGGGRFCDYIVASGPYVGVLACNAVCSYSGTTTSTTTTSTTTAPPGTVYLYPCGGGLALTCCDSVPMDCGTSTPTAGPYATCGECIAANPTSSGCVGCSP